MCRPVFFVVFLYIVACVEPLSISNRCGTSACLEYEYCSRFLSKCHDCSSMCEATSYRFEREDCQDYLRDIRYVRTFNYEDDLEKLRAQQKLIFLIVICILILLLLTCLTKLLRWVFQKSCRPVKRVLSARGASSKLDESSLQSPQSEQMKRAVVTASRETTF